MMSSSADTTPGTSQMTSLNRPSRSREYSRLVKRRKSTDETQESQHGVLQNLIDTTRCCIAHKDHSKHVSTYAERSALKLLKRFGSVLVKGRSGSGKSRMALRLLSELHKETNRTPVLLSFPHEWKLIPHGKEGCDFVVLIDDIFGSSNLVKNQVDEWVKLFEIIWSSVESGHVFLVITSRPEIIAQCSNKIKSYKLMKNTRPVDLESSTYELTSYEKEKLLRKSCGKNPSLSEGDIKWISKTKTSLGFPQCCEFFASSKTAQEKGVMFFWKPYIILQEMISVMKECDPVGYAVLLLLLMHNGFLDVKLLNPFKSAKEFDDVLRSVSHVCGLSTAPTYGELKHKAQHLHGVYLTCTDKGYYFQHQSIFDTIFLEMAKEYPEACIKICPVQMLIELVRTSEPECDEVVIHLKQEMYGILADRITEILLNNCEIEILEHSSMNHAEFFQYMIINWHNGELKRLAQCQTKPAYLAYTKHVLWSVYVSEEEYVLLELDNLLAIMLLDCTSVINYIFEACPDIQEIDLSPQVLTCAIYTSQKNIIKSLLDKGMVPIEKDFRALCESKDLDDDVIDRILKQVKLDFVKLEDPDDMLYLASMNGNKRIVEFFMNKINHDKATVAFNCLYYLFTYFKHATKVQSVLTDNVLQKLDEVIKFIYSFIPLDDEDTYTFPYLCVFHTHSVCLKAHLERVLTADKVLNTKCFSIAVRHGGSSCMDLLLKHGVERKEIQSQTAFYFCTAAESERDSHAKIKLLHGVFSESEDQELLVHCDINMQNVVGTTPLHTAVHFGNTEAFHALKDLGASVNVRDKWGMAPLHVAVQKDHLDSFMDLLKAGAEVNMKDSHGATALFYTEQKSIAKKLVDSGCHVNTRDKYGNLPVHKAAQKNDVRNLAFLLSKGSEVNSSNNDGVSLLHVASEFGDSELVEYLCGEGATPSTDKNGTSVLHYAARSRIEPVEKMRYIIDTLKVPLDVEDKLGRTVLFSAVESGDLEVIEYLIDRGLKLKHKDQNGNTLLHALSFGFSRHIDCDRILAMLLDGGVNPDDCGYGNRTALHMVLEHDTWNKSTSLCKALIEKTSTVNAVDAYGRTPLHHAVRYGNVEFVELLLQKGGNKDLKDCFDCVAVDYVDWYAGKDADGQKAVLKGLLTH